MSSKRGLARERTPFEVAILAVALLAVVGIVTGLLLSGGGGSGSQPDLRANVRATGLASGGQTYLVTVRNNGGRTAENVVVEVTIGSESRETELLAVARRDAEHAIVVFPPGTTGAPQVAILSYTEPAR